MAASNPRKHIGIRWESELGSLFPVRQQQIHFQNSAVEDPQSGGGLRAGLDAFFAVAEDPRVARVCMQEVLGVSSEVDALYNQSNARFAQMILKFVSARRKDLNTSSVEARVVARSLVGALIQAGSTWRLNDYDVSRKTMVAACYRIFVGDILS